MWSREYLIKTISYYRELHFFSDEAYKNLSDIQLTDKLLNSKLLYTNCFKEMYNDDFCYDGSIEDEIVIILCDKKRIINIPTDTFSQRIKPSYSFDCVCKTLESISSISRSLFIPKNIIELGYKEIEFSLGNYQYKLFINGYCDDPCILCRQINMLICNSDYQFEAVAQAPDIFITLLSTNEKEKLSKEKNWNFVQYLNPSCNVDIL